MTGTEFLYALLAGVIPSMVWLFFWTREDSDQPEPRALLAACFLGGMLAVLLAIPAEKYVATLVSDQSYQYLFWAAIEEAFKLIAVLSIAFMSRWNDEPIDAMIYFIAVALGFAALENVLFILGSVSDGGLASSVVTANMRFFGATLVHVVSSSLIGFGLGLTFFRGRLAKVIGGLAGLAAATAIHAAFNLTVVNSGPNDTLRIFAWVWAGVVIVIVLFEEIKAVRPADAPAINTSRLT
ncbi:MAG: PrsW family intramembrane metalloprotease [Patescibacteria group bacterium]|nr:PrsW family intramembrane metalloprotease [Patescibacteria group bacterium]